MSEALPEERIARIKPLFRGFTDVFKKEHPYVSVYLKYIAKYKNKAIFEEIFDFLIHKFPENSDFLAKLKGPLDALNSNQAITKIEDRDRANQQIEETIDKIIADYPEFKTFSDDFYLMASELDESKNLDDQTPYNPNLDRPIQELYREYESDPLTPGQEPREKDIPFIRKLTDVIMDGAVDGKYTMKDILDFHNKYPTGEILAENENTAKEIFKPTLSYAVSHTKELENLGGLTILLNPLSMAAGLGVCCVYGAFMLYDHGVEQDRERRICRAEAMRREIIKYRKAKQKQIPPPNLNARKEQAKEKPELKLPAK